MISDQIGALLRAARVSSGLSQAELARRGGVSTRLVAEVERGQRPNVGLEAVLRLLGTAGVSVSLAGPNGAAVELRAPSADARERAARAARRRETWSGRHVALARSGVAPTAGRLPAERLAAAMQISQQAHAMSRAGRVAGAASARDDDAGASRPARRRQAGIAATKLRG